jgi:hypothetical protein
MIKSIINNLLYLFANILQLIVGLIALVAVNLYNKIYNKPGRKIVGNNMRWYSFLNCGKLIKPHRRINKCMK